MITIMQCNYTQRVSCVPVDRDHSIIRKKLHHSAQNVNFNLLQTRSNKQILQQAHTLNNTTTAKQYCCVTYKLSLVIGIIHVS